MTVSRMVNNREPGPGERADLARRRYKQRLAIALFIFGGLVGGLIGGLARPGDKALTDLAALSLPPVAAVLLAGAMIIGMVIAPIYMFSQVDELAVRRNLRGMAAGWLAVMGGFPAWFLLAAGGLAPAPSALGLFLLAYGVTLVTFVILKLRD